MCIRDRLRTLMRHRRISEYQSRSEGFPRTGYLVPARSTPGVLPDGQSCWDVVIAAVVSWFHRGAIAPRTPHLAYLARGRVIPECLVLQYFQIHELYQNAWSFSISRFTGHTRMLGLLTPKVQRYKFRHPKHKFRHPKYSGISSDTQSISSKLKSKGPEKFRKSVLRLKPNFLGLFSKYIIDY